MSSSYDPLVSIVLPTYNPAPTLLSEALESAAAQTLHGELYEIILVDDCSESDVAEQTFESIKSVYESKGIRFKFVRHDENQWLAAARTTGAKQSDSPYIVFLDDDDKLAPDYIEKCLLLLAASDQHDWVYTNHKKFGQRNEFREAPSFNPFLFTIRNRVSYSSMFRRDAWLKIGQRKIEILDNLNQFEDWDMYVRLLLNSRIGTPLRDTDFHYRKSSTGLAARSLREYIISSYKMFRSHGLKAPLLVLPFLKHRRLIRKGHSQRSIFHPMRHVNGALSYISKRFLGVNEFPGSINFSMLFEAVFSPSSFSNRIVTDRNFLSLAGLRSGYRGLADMSFTKQRPFPTIVDKNVVLAGHIWWKMGGAENIYWYWLKAAKSAGASRILDVVSQDNRIDSVKKQEFATVCEQQYNLLGFGDSPQQRLRALWNLIMLERPRLIFISSNSFLYQLTPYIKQEFPDIQIIDILHNEYDGLIDWFTTSADYDQYIDKRIVTSNYWKDILVNKYRVEPSKVAVHRNPVDTELYDPNRFDANALKSSFKLDENKTVISFIGRLHPQKGLDRFLLMVEALQSDPNLQFVIAGDGELQDDVKSLVKKIPSLAYLGYFPTVEKVLAVTDILICPSLYEGAPLIGLEAAAMNISVIAPNLVGFKEQIEEGNFGVLYESSFDPYNDVELFNNMLTGRLKEIYDLGKNGREFILKTHSFDVVEKDYINELKGFLDE